MRGQLGSATHTSYLSRRINPDSFSQTFIANTLFAKTTRHDGVVRDGHHNGFTGYNLLCLIMQNSESISTNVSQYIAIALLHRINGLTNVSVDFDKFSTENM